MKKLSRRHALALFGAAPAAAALVWTDVEARQAHDHAVAAQAAKAGATSNTVEGSKSDGLRMQDDQIPQGARFNGVGSAIIIRELDKRRPLVEQFEDCPDLPAREFLPRAR